MVEGPINYTGMLVRPDLTPLMQGLQLRRQNQAQDAQQQRWEDQTALKQQEFERQAAAQSAWDADIQGVMAAPTTASLSSLMLKHPERYQAIKAMSDQQGEVMQKRNLTAAMEVGGLLNAGANDAALAKLKDRRTALAANGESTEITDHIIANIESGDSVKITQAKALAGTVIATTLGEKAGPVLDSLGYGARAEDREADNERANRIADMRERVAEASIARGEASSARAERAADRADRKAAGGGSGGGGSGGSYEYRIGPDGRLQRRKR